MPRRRNRLRTFWKSSLLSSQTAPTRASTSVATTTSESYTSLRSPRLRQGKSPDARPISARTLFVVVRCSAWLYSPIDGMMSVEKNNDRRLQFQCDLDILFVSPLAYQSSAMCRASSRSPTIASLLEPSVIARLPDRVTPEPRTCKASQMMYLSLNVYPRMISTRAIFVSR